MYGKYMCILPHIGIGGKFMLLVLFMLLATPKPGIPCLGLGYGFPGSILASASCEGLQSKKLCQAV